MSFEKQPNYFESLMTRSNCAGCGQNDKTLYQSKYGQQAQAHRQQTNSSSASNCSC